MDRDDGLGGFPRFLFASRFWHGIYLADSTGARFLCVRCLRKSPDNRRSGYSHVPRPQRSWMGRGVTIVSAEYGMMTLSPKVVLIATGVRESTRAERRISGHRPSDGFVTTGETAAVNYSWRGYFQGATCADRGKRIGLILSPSLCAQGRHSGRWNG